MLPIFQSTNMLAYFQIFELKLRNIYEYHMKTVTICMIEFPIFKLRIPNQFIIRK